MLHNLKGSVFTGPIVFTYGLYFTRHLMRLDFYRKGIVMSMVQDIYELELRWKNGTECIDPVIRNVVMEAREKICDIMNDTQIEAYNQLEDALGINIKSERMICDDIAYLQLFNSAWTCELIRNGYSIRVLDETIYLPEYRRKHEFFSRFKQDIHYLIVITIEMI